ncbi:MAG: hypothetical protein HQM08_30060 [Candidatus Riflebacteria bacterium]|nr:hypothetical protein [Candidatus Riflebacteria bacterium]
MQLDIFLNPSANRNTSQTNWSKVEEALKKQSFEVRLKTSSSRENLISTILESINGGARKLVAAGGDGTFQILLDSVMSARIKHPELLNELFIGAIGMGTSNDFHKPFTPEKMLGGFPAKVREEASKKHDVLMLTVKSPDGSQSVRHFLQSSNVGAIPVTNEVLTQERGFLHSLYNYCYPLGLPLASLYVLFTYEGFEGVVQVGEEKFEGLFTGMTLLKRPYMAGSFVFKTNRVCDDGLMDLGLCKKVGAFRSLALTGAFQNQGFGGHPEVIFREISSVSVMFSKPQTVDIDGELIKATEATWKVLPKALNILG